jgi:hypothetical protein
MEARMSEKTMESWVYQDKHGNYFLHRSDHAEDEPISEFEVRRFVQTAVERMQIQNAVDNLAALLAFMGSGFLTK